jgi:PAS domain-containing protein
MHGYNQEEIIGQHYFMLIHPDERSSLKERMDKRLAMGENLRKSEERYKEIVEGTDDLIIKVDNNGLIVFANSMANKIFGLPQKDIICMHISKCIHHDDKDNTRTLIDRCVAKKH